jgi:Acetyltransferase (GNAT) domain
MKQLSQYCIRIITDAEQLTEAFSLRYKVYEKTFPRCTAGLEQPFETDEFDCRSVHLGLYLDDATCNTLIGYCRLILPEVFALQYSGMLVKQHPLYPEQITNTSSDRISFVKRLPALYKEKLNSFWDDLELKELAYCETGRFIIGEKFRSISLSTFFVEGMFAIFQTIGGKYSFFTCTHHHIPFYSRFGFVPFPGLGIYDDETFESEMSVVFGTDISLISSQKPTITALVKQIENQQKICLRKVA